MKCPVCGNINTSMVCPKCGFDSSRDYERYPTFGMVGRVPSTSGLRDQWREDPTAPQLVKPERRVPVWLMAAICAVTMVLGIWIGSGFIKPDPAGPGESAQMQEPRKGNILRSDEIPDEGYETYGDIRGYPVFGSDYRREQICSVTFLDTLADAPEDAWDVSEAGDGTVMAWVKRNESVPDPTSSVANMDLYDLYIGAEGGVRAGQSCREMFAGYWNVRTFSFAEAFRSDDAEDMYSMFNGCFLIQTLDLSSFDTAHVQDLGNMFRNCAALQNLILGEHFVTDNADTRGMFEGCPAGDEWSHLKH